MRPIFVTGCSRSGTTMLGSMLGARPDVLTVPETQFLVAAINEVAARGGDMETAEIVERMTSHWRFRIWNVAVDVASCKGSEAGGSPSAVMDWIVREYGRSVGKPDFDRWVDHTPTNVHHLVRLFEAFPEARAVHLVRDGRAVAASVLPLDWGPNAIIAAARWWMMGIAPGLAAESHWGPDRIVRVRYEDLVLDPEATLRTLCAALDLEYDPAMAGGAGFSVPEFTAGQHRLVGDRPQPQRVTAWEQRLTPRQIELFETTTGDVLRYLGYELKCGSAARPATRGELLCDGVYDLFKLHAVNRWRLLWRRKRSARR